MPSSRQFARMPSTIPREISKYSIWRSLMGWTAAAHPRHRRPGKALQGVAAALVGRQSKSRSHLESARCRVENLLRDQVVPCTTDGLRSPGGSEARRLVSKIVDSCQHSVTTAGED